MRDSAGAVFTLAFTLLALTAALMVARAQFGAIPLLGALPGDLHVPLPHGSIYLPLGSSLLVSLVLCAVASLVISLKQKDYK